MDNKAKKQQQSESSDVPWYMEPEYKNRPIKLEPQPGEDRMAELISSVVIPDVYPPPPTWDPDAPENNMTAEEIQAEWDEEYRQKIEKIMGGPPPKQETD
tara:strand:- start:53 stop:352 length:300 start_codon:yes stop_codon:yes gene_type:complete